MLDAYVIEEIRRRERERQQDDRPVIEIPAPAPPSPSSGGADGERKDDRGVVIIDYSG